MQELRCAIKMLRCQHRLTQQMMAEKLHLSLNAYTNIERGLTQLNEKRLQQIATVFGLSVYDLFLITTNNQQPTTNNQQPTTNNQQPTTNNQQPTTNIMASIICCVKWIV